MTAKLLDADPVVLAVTAGAVFALHADGDDDDPDFAAPHPPGSFLQLVDRACAAFDDSRTLTAAIERMPLTDRAQVLDEALDLWASYGRQYPP